MIDFPNSPSDGQTFLAPTGVQYRWVAASSLWLATSGTTPGGDFCAYSSAPPSLVANTVTQAILNTIYSGNAGGWYNTSTGRYTPPAGRYLLMAGFFATVPSASQLQTSLRKNGVNLAGASSNLLGVGGQVPNVNWYGDPQGTAIVDASGTDYFDFTIYSGVATPVSSIWFMAFPLSGVQGPAGPVGPGAIGLYSEVVLAASAAEMRVNIPAGAKRIDLQFGTINAGGTNDNLNLNLLNGAAIVSGSIYGIQSMYGSGGAAPGASSAFPTAQWIVWPNMNTFNGIIHFQLFNSGVVGVGNIGATNLAGADLVAAQSYKTSPTPATGFRLSNNGGTLFTAGSFMRVYTGS
jgi:hypothetical protein